MDRSSKQKINKETQVLNDTWDEMDLIDIFRTFHSNAEEYTFFSSPHGTFSRIDHILSHKSNLSKFKKVEIKHNLWPQRYETRYQLQEKNYKKHKRMEIKQSDQIRSVAQSCPTLYNPMNRSTPGLPVHHQLLDFTQTHVHRVSDAIQPSHPLSSPSPPAPNPSQHQSLFQWVNSSHEVAKVLEFQL